MGPIAHPASGRHAVRRARMASPPRLGGGRIPATVLAVTVAALILLAAPAARASSPDIVVSEIYLGGGAADSRYDASFVELFNRGGAPVDLNGWTLQSRTTSGGWFSTSLYGSIQSGGYYLIRVGAPGQGAISLGQPDAQAGLVAGGAATGALAVVTGQTLLTCGAAPDDCASVTTIRDLVGWGASTAAERAPGTSASATTSLTRVPAGATGFPSRNGACHDDDDNAAEFRALPPTPQGSFVPAAPCPVPDSAPTVAETTPASGATDVPPDQPITIRFSEPVDRPRATIYCTGVETVLALRSDDGVSFTASHRRFRYGDRCALVVAAGSARDHDQDDPPDGLAADVVVQFATAAPTEFATLRTTSATLLPGGWLNLNVSCSPQAVTACTGRVVLTSQAAPATRTSPARQVRIGTGRFVIAYRAKARVGVRLNALGKAALAAQGRLVATATVTSEDAAGRTLESASRLVIHPRRTQPAR